MPQHPTQDHDWQIEKSFTDLWALLMVAMGVDEPQEIARLVATGIPAVLRCSLSGLALRREPGSDWHVALEHAGRPSISPDTEACGLEPERIFAAAITQSTLRFSTHEPHPHDGLLRPFAEKLSLSCLIVFPLLTLHSRLGLLFVGKQCPEGFS